MDGAAHRCVEAGAGSFADNVGLELSERAEPLFLHDPQPFLDARPKAKSEADINRKSARGRDQFERWAQQTLHCA
jgi:hypothetical protein